MPQDVKSKGISTGFASQTKDLSLGAFTRNGIVGATHGLFFPSCFQDAIPPLRERESARKPFPRRRKAPMDPSILLSILCALAWGVQSILLKKAMRDIPLSTAILFTLAINFLVVVFLIGAGVGDGVSAFLDIPLLIWFYFMVAGFINYLLGRGLFYSSFRFIGVTQSTAISSTYPVLSVVFAICVLGEKLAFLQFVGIGLTLSGIYLLMLKGKR
jgi:drug/metabolite transporter (DMT)-like permease